MHTSRILIAALLALPACASSAPTPDATRQIAVLGATPLDGWSLWNPDQRVGDPRAGEPSYVYLLIGQDAVLLPGPTVTVDDATADLIFGDGTASIDWQVTGENDAGLTVVVSGGLTYQFDIQDFENEISPIRVELSRFGNDIESRFVFAADGDPGVAHQATIRATLAATTTAPTGPWTIEARSPTDP